jgi:hypothetical protein
MKQLSAILFGLSLVWAQLPAAPGPATPAKPAQACCHCGGKMSCCSAPSSGSQPMPAIPSNAETQKQLSISAPAFVVGVRPECRAGVICPAPRLSMLPDGAPLYARYCARLV